GVELDERRHVRAGNGLATRGRSGVDGDEAGPGEGGGGESGSGRGHGGHGAWEIALSRGRGQFIASPEAFAHCSCNRRLGCADLRTTSRDPSSAAAYYLEGGSDDLGGRPSDLEGGLRRLEPGLPRKVASYLPSSTSCSAPGTGVGA